MKLPPLRVRQGGYRFLPNGKSQCYLKSIAWPDFELFDLKTEATRPLTRFSNANPLRTFDITPDGKYVVFDRTRPNADIVPIDVPKPGGTPPGPASR